MTELERIREVEEHLKRWRREQAQAAAAERDAADIAFAHGDGGPVQSSTISDKTARGAELLAANARLIKWVDTIAEAMAWMRQDRPDLYNLLRGHYGMEYPRGYRRRYAKSFTESFRKVYRIGITTYHEMRKEALREISGWAIEAGLQSVKRCRISTAPTNANLLAAHDGIVNNSIPN